LVDWFSNDKYIIEKVAFDDGTYFSSDDINKIIQEMATYSANSLDISAMETTTVQNDLTLVSSY
ncbi:MAG TPA: hypothetical protein DDX14_01790, partial [Cyanobacteria bacterium UBA9579]|nr:hypothetical protein [Cyanobacteria bacterium UBA9579]